MPTKEETVERINAVAEMLGITPEQLLAAAMNAGPEKAVLQEQDKIEQPAAIVYPKVAFPPYKYREYPKLLYKGIIRDVEEPYTKINPDGSHTNFVRVIPDQFVQETKEVANKAEEALSLVSGWYLTRGEAIEVAKAVKAAARPIIEKPAPVRRGRPPKAASGEHEGGEDAGSDNPMQEPAAA